MSPGTAEPPSEPPGASRRQSKLPCAPQAHCGEFRLVVTDCERGESPLSHFLPNPRPANRVRCHLFFARTRQYATTCESRGHGAPVSDRHRAGARNPHRRRRPPPISRLRTHASPTAQNYGYMERRSPTGIARERETCTDDAGHPNLTAENPRIANRAELRGHGAPVSDRHRARARNLHRRRWPPQSHGCEPTHRQPRRITGTWSAGLRPASRGSAKPAPTTLATPISRLRTHASPTAQNHGDMERRSPTGIARERETCTDDAGHASGQFSRWGPAPLREAQRTGRTSNIGMVGTAARTSTSAVVLVGETP